MLSFCFRTWAREGGESNTYNLANSICAFCFDHLLYFFRGDVCRGRRIWYHDDRTTPFVVNLTGMCFHLLVLKMSGDCARPWIWSANTGAMTTESQESGSWRIAYHQGVYDRHRINTETGGPCRHTDKFSFHRQLLISFCKMDGCFIAYVCVSKFELMLLLAGLWVIACLLATQQHYHRTKEHGGKFSRLFGTVNTEIFVCPVPVVNVWMRWFTTKSRLGCEGCYLPCEVFVRDMANKDLVLDAFDKVLFI